MSETATIAPPAVAELGPSAGEISPEQAERSARVAEAQASTAYWTMARQAIEGQRNYLSSLDGGLQTRLDTPWPRGDRYIGPAREQDQENLASLRDRARNLEIVNPLASATLDRYGENVVGVGIRIKPMTRDERFNAGVKRWLKGWSKPLASDVRGMYSFSALMRMGLRAKGRDGDNGLVLATVPRIGENGLVEFRPDGLPKRNPRLQLIEGDRIKNPVGVLGGVAGGISGGRLANGNQIVEGVEMDGNGRPMGFHVGYRNAANQEQSVRVASRDFIFWSCAGRYSNARGESKFRGTFGTYDQLWAALEAVVVAWRVGASQAMITKTKNPAARQAALRTVTTAGGVQEKWQSIQAGMINHLDIDEDLVAFNPSQPNQQLEAAADLFARLIGLKWGLTLEQVLLKFANLSWSTSKAVRAQIQQTAGQEREDIVDNGISRIYQWALSIAIQNGDIVDEEGLIIPEPRNSWEHEWIPPAMADTDPLKTMQARKMALELDLDARSFQAAEDGYDFDDLVGQNDKDREKLRKAGKPAIEEIEAAGKTGGSVTVDENGKVVITPAQKSEDRGQGSGVRGQGSGAEGETSGQAPLNGVQITAAMEVLAKLTEGTIPLVAAVEMLERLGIAPDKAAKIAAAAEASRSKISGTDREFQRTVYLKLLDVPAAREAAYNGTDMEDLHAQVGLPAEENYEFPWIPVKAAAGDLVSGATVLDPSGDIVGGDVTNELPPDAPTLNGGTRNADAEKAGTAGTAAAPEDGGE